MGKKSLLLVFFLALMLIPSNVFAMSSKEAANKMNNYIKNAIFNNAWKVTNSKSNSSNYDIKINFTNTNNSTFKEVINNIPTKLFDGNSYKVKVFLFDCGSGSCSESVRNESVYITFYMAKTSSSNIYLYANNVAPSVYEKVIDGNAWYEISTNQKGVGGDVTKKGKSAFSSSQEHDDTQVDRAMGTLTNPQIIGNNATISLPAKNSSFWKGKTDQCYYFKVNFNSNSNKMARYELSPVTDQSYQINYIIDGRIAGIAFRDALDTKLYGLSKDNLYGACLYSTATEDKFYGKKITFTFKDTENVNIGSSFDADLAEEQLGEGNVNKVDTNPFNDNSTEWEKIDGTLSSKNFDGSIGCDSIFSKEEGTIGWMLNTVLNYIKIIGPVLVVLLSAIDFIKAVVGFDEKAMKEAQNKLIIRLVAALALFLVPTLVQLLLSFINMTTCTI